MLAHVPSFGRNPRGSPDFLAYPVPKACMHVLGTRVPRRLGVARSASSPKAAQALGCSLTPGLRISFGRVTCMARAASVPGLWALGFLLLACVCGWVRVAVGRGFCLPLPVVAGVLGGCVWARFVVPLLPAVSGVRGWALVSACFRDLCGFVRVSLAPRRFRYRCAVWACVLGPGLGCAPPFLAGLSGCVFCAFFFFVCFFFSGCWVSLSRALWSLPPSPFFRAGLLAFFFFFCVCLLRCPFSPWAAVPGLVLPVLAGWSPCACLGVLSSVPSGWGVWPPSVLLGGGLVAVGCFRAAPHPPFFWGGGGACLAVPPFAFPRLLLCGWCLVWLVPRHSWRRFLCATPRHSWLGFAAGGGGRSPPLLAGVCRRRWCVACGGGVLVGLWLVCGVVGPSPLLAEVPVCYSPPLLAGFRCRWWWAVPATPGWGPLAALLCGVWCVAVVCWWGSGWCVVWLVPRHSWRRFLCATPRHSWLGFAAGGGGRSPPLLAGVRLWRWCVVCGVWCVVCGGGVLVGLWLVCGVVGPSPLLAVVPVCYSPPLLAGFRCRWWWAVPATPGWGPLAAVVCGVWCVVCGGGVLVGLWLVCGVVGPSPLLAVVPVCYSPPLLAGFRCRWWLAVPATPGWGPLAAVVCGVWCVAVVCWWGCGWCVVWLVPRHSWRWFLCATPRHSWLGFAAGGGGRSPPLLAGVRWRRRCVVCGGGVLLGLWLVCGVVGPSPLLAEVPVCYSPPLLAGFRCRWWWAVPATPGWGPLAAVMCGVWCVVCGVLLGSLATPGGRSCVLLPATPGWVSLPLVVGGPRHSWLGSPGGGGVRALLGRVGRAGLPGAFWCASPFPLAALSFCFAWPPPGWGCRSLFRCCCRSSLVVFLGLPLPGPRLVCVSRLAVGFSLVVAPPLPPPFVSRGFRLSCLWPWCFFFSPSSSSSVRPRCLRLSLVSGPGCPEPGRLRCLFCWPSASRLSVRLSLFRAFRLAVGCSRVVAAPPPPLFLPLGAVCRVVLCVPGCGAAPRCAALCRPLLCCRVLCCARLVPLLVAPCPLALPVALGPVLCSAVFCGAPPRCVLCAVCVLLWRGGACCCSPLCLVLCVSRGAVLCVPCALRSVRCCASLCWCARVVLFVWCVLLLAPGAVVRCCVLCCFLWCAVVRRWVWWPVVVCWWRVSVSVSLTGRVVCVPVVGVVCCGALLSCVVFCGAVLSRGAVLLCSAVVLRCCWGLLCPPVSCRAVLCCAVGWLCCFWPRGGVCVLWCSFPRGVRSLSSPLCALRWLVVLAVVPCFPVSCAVALCCRVVLCCRALPSFCGAVCVCFALLRPVVRRQCGLRCCWCLVLWRVPVRCGVSLGVLRCGGAALVCRGVLLCCALSCGVLHSVPCPAVPCCPAVLCWLAVLCGCLRCWCLFFLLSSFPLLKTPAVFPCL